MANVNLIPESEGKKASWARLNITGLIIVIIVVALVLGGMFVWQRVLVVREESIISEVDKVMAEQEKYADIVAEADTLQVQLASLNQLLDDHVYWTELFWQLEASSLKNNTIDILQATKPGKVDLQGSIPSYNDLAKQMVAYQSNDFFNETKLNNAILTTAEDGTNSISYSMELWLSGDALHKTDEQVLEDSLRDYNVTQPPPEVSEEGEEAEQNAESAEGDSEAEQETENNQ